MAKDADGQEFELGYKSPPKEKDRRGEYFIICPKCVNKNDSNVMHKRDDKWVCLVCGEKMTDAQLEGMVGAHKGGGGRAIMIDKDGKEIPL